MARDVAKVLVIGGGLAAIAYYLMRSNPAAAAVAQTTAAGAASQPASSGAVVAGAAPGSGFTPAAIAAEGANTLLPIDVTLSDQSAGVLAPTLIQVQASGSFWETLTPAADLSSGWIDFPTGSQAAASLMQVRQDASGNRYVEWAGQVYELGPQDGAGNYPASLASAQ